MDPMPRPSQDAPLARSEPQPTTIHACSPLAVIALKVMMRPGWWAIKMGLRAARLVVQPAGYALTFPASPSLPPDSRSLEPAADLAGAARRAQPPADRAARHLQIVPAQASLAGRRA